MADFSFQMNEPLPTPINSDLGYGAGTKRFELVETALKQRCVTQENELSDLRAANQALQAKLILAEEKNRKLLAELQTNSITHETEIQQLQKFCEKYRAAADNDSGELQKLRNLQTLLIKETEIQKEEIARQQEIRKDLEQKIKSQEQEKQAALSSLEITQKQLTLSQKMPRVDRIKYERHDLRLREYGQALNKAKSEIKKIAKEMAEEIETARAMHPLKDYLSLTEFELSKVELHFKTTPTSSSERPRLEACLKQLIEQRDFLRSVIEASQRELQLKAAFVLKLVQSKKLAVIPPPPPLPAREGECP